MQDQSQAEASGLTLAARPMPPDLPPLKGDQVRLTQALHLHSGCDQGLHLGSCHTTRPAGDHGVFPTADY